MTTNELMTAWLDRCERERVKPRTYSRYKGLIVQHILPELGDTQIDDLGRRQISEFLTAHQADGNLRGEALSATSTNLMLTVLNAAFTYACDMELLPANPCDRIRRVPGPPSRVEAFTREEQRRLEEAIAVSEDRRLFGIRLCLYTGLRIGELLGLEWQDVDMEKGILHIGKTVYREKNAEGEWQLFVDRPKTAASERMVPLPGYLAEDLRIYRRGARSEFVIENKKAERMSIRSYQYLFERLTEKAGVRKLNFHALRHTFATRALECGMDIKTLSELMGHKNATITLNRYAHSMMDTKIAAMNKLEKLF